MLYKIVQVVQVVQDCVQYCNGLVCSLQGVVKVILELSNKNCDHGSHIPEVQLGEVSRLKLRV